MFHKTELTFKEELQPRKYTDQIILFHSADAKPHSVKDVHRAHQQNLGMAGIAYHFFIDKDGEIFEGRPLHTKGSFLKECNSNSIGICFEGNFNIEKMEEQQFHGAIMLLSLLSLAYETNSILPYWKCTEKWGSPGSNFPIDKIICEIEECKDLFTRMFGHHWNETEDEYFYPDYEWRHAHDYLGNDEDEACRHNAPDSPIPMGNFNYFKILQLLNDVVEDY